MKVPNIVSRLAYLRIPKPLKQLFYVGVLFSFFAAILYLRLAYGKEIFETYAIWRTDP